ncbi:MAG: serine/threonine protein kinase [Bryobacterales bacterium]|jgi:serine/threonine-protein kinase|nr:serine/threonine protein kinase [Bryobacterales bacterium]
MTGRTIGHYRMIDKLGEGGMGKVYRAVDVMVDREVALKSLKAELAARPEVVERFRSEAITLARLNHPNVAQLYAFFKDGNEYFMVMEFVAGRTLEQTLLQGGPMPWPQALEIAAQVLDGIQHAHQLGILHRDIKPANIILPDTRRSTGGFQPLTKVTDFGIAQALGNARMTREGHLIGTLEYMAPERIQGKGAGPQSDLYSMAIVLYEMLTGRLPFQSQSEYSLLLAQVQEPPPRLRQWLQSIPSGVEAVVLRALSKDPAQRYPDATSFAAALRAQVAQPATQGEDARGMLAECCALLGVSPARLRQVTIGSTNRLVATICVATIFLTLLGSLMLIGITRLVQMAQDGVESEAPAAASPPPEPAVTAAVPERVFEPGVPIPIGKILGDRDLGSADAVSESPAPDPPVLTDAQQETPTRPDTIGAAPLEPRISVRETPQPRSTRPAPASPGPTPDLAELARALDLTDGPTSGNPGEWPIHRAGLLRALEVTHGQALRELTDAVKRRGVNFLLTPSLQSQLRNAGADAALLDAVANGLRSFPSPEVSKQERGAPAAPPAPKLKVVGTLGEVQRLFVAKMAGNMDVMLRSELQRSLKGRVLVTTSATQADARIEATEEQAQGGLFASAGRAMGLKDRYRLRVRVVSTGSSKELWNFETGDRNSMTATHGSRAMQKAVDRISGELRDALR